MLNETPPRLGKGAIVVIIVVVVITAAIYFVAQRPSTQINTDVASNTSDVQEAANNINIATRADTPILWEFRDNEYVASGTPPACPDPLEFPAPVDVTLADGILYPGQIRGTDYKPHGGFRFDSLSNNEVEVRAIMDGYITKAAKYNDGYDDQVLIFFVNDCGIMVMHDHLLTLSPKLEEILKDVPLKTDGDSRTTQLKRVDIKKEELLATEIGYPEFPGGANGKNIFLDFGLYDLRITNNIEYSEKFRAQHPNINEYGTHALCWFDYLASEEMAIVKNLPASGAEGSQSDYCI